MAEKVKKRKRKAKEPASAYLTISNEIKDKKANLVEITERPSRQARRRRGMI